MIDDFKAHLIQELEKRKKQHLKDKRQSAEYVDQEYFGGCADEIQFCINLINNTIVSNGGKKV